MDTSRIGDISELQACVWLLKQGYEVFRNVGSSGPLDLIAMKDGHIILIDVKKLNLLQYGNIALNTKGEKRMASFRASILYVTDAGDCFWSPCADTMKAAEEL